MNNSGVICSPQLEPQLTCGSHRHRGDVPLADHLVAAALPLRHDAQVDPGVGGRGPVQLQCERVHRRARRPDASTGILRPLLRDAVPIQADDRGGRGCRRGRGFALPGNRELAFAPVDFAGEAQTVALPESGGVLQLQPEHVL